MADTHVHVFVTKNNKFRARVSAPGNIYEVTVGGEQWTAGKGKEHFNSIVDGMARILSALYTHYSEIIQSPERLNG